MRVDPEPVITRISEDRIIEDHGRIMRHIETVTIDRGERLGSSTVTLLMQPDIKLGEWLERARPSINKALQNSDYRLAL